MTRQKYPVGYRKFLVGNYAPRPGILIGGQRARVFDNNGNNYIDFAGGIAVSALGHGDAKFADAIGAQAGRLIHVSNLFVHDNLVSVAAKLTAATGMQQVFFCNSGAEANECALKIARKRGVAIARSKYRVISLQGAFHGRIGLALAASQAKLWQSFGPQPPGFAQVEATASALRQAFDQRVCAALVEPIQGEAGVRVIAPQLLELLRKLCLKHDALLICDEVQTGMGRTGTMLCGSVRTLKPDIVTLGKGIGNGFPVAATLVSRRAKGVLGPGDHGTTYGGNPLALKAVEQILDRLAKPVFLRRVRAKSSYLHAKVYQLIKRGAPIVEIRGKGLMIGLRLDQKLTAANVFARAMDEGVLIAPAGDNVVRLLPPLTISKQEMDVGIRRLGKALFS